MHRSKYSDLAFRQKVKTCAKKAGRDVIETALKLYYALQDSDTPKSAKSIIIGALVYFITPTDAIPDFLPGGYTDDLGALVGAAWTVANHIKEEHVKKASETLILWFGGEENKANTQ